MSRYLFIVNPAAGGGRGEKAGKFLRSAFPRDNHRVDLVYTSSRGEAARIAREASADIVVAVGGDGTTNEVGNGLFGTGKKLGLVPAGSGNDLVKSLRIPSSPSEALQVLWNGHSALFDAGRVVCTRNPSSGDSDSIERLFFNGIGIGFDAAVAGQAAGLRYLRGTMRYLVAVILTLRRFDAPLLDFSVDGKSFSRKKMLLVAVDNGICAGGGFLLTPDARTDDGELDFCAIDQLSAASVLRLIPKVLRASHATAKGVQLGRGISFSVRSESGVPVHADGEVLTADAVAIKADAVRGALNVICPA